MSSSNNTFIVQKMVEQLRLATQPDSEPDDFFEFFVADQHLKDLSLTQDQIDNGIVGESLDGGVDSLYIFVDGLLIEESFDADTVRQNPSIRLTIYQSKRETGFKQDMWLKLIPTVRDLLDLSADPASFGSTYNSALVEKFVLFREVYTALLLKAPKLQIDLVYATQAAVKDIAEPVKQAETTLQATVRSAFPSAEINTIYIDAGDLIDLFQRSPSQVMKLAISGQVINATNSYVFLVRLGEYVDAVTESGELRQPLLDENVRDFQTLSADVNKEIMESLKTPQMEDFWWLNNGVTILAADATVHKNQVVISDAKIVNGLQTTYVLYAYAQGAPMIADDSRLILVRTLIAQDEDVRDRIIRATNRQTPIPVTSLTATEPVQRDIETYLLTEGWFYERRHNYYKIRNKPAKRIVSRELLAQAYMATVLQRPNDARARPRTALKKDYSQIFSSSKPMAVYKAALEVFGKCDEYLASLKHPRRTNLRFHLSMLAMVQLCKTIYVDDGQAQRADATQLKVSDLQVLTGLAESALIDFAQREGQEEDTASKNAALDQDLLMLWDLLKP